MNIAVRNVDFKSLADYQVDSRYGLRWPSFCVLPAFLKSWWRVFGDKAAETYILAVGQNEEIVGIAPLQLKDGVATFIGSADVCDYLDCITVPGREAEFFGALLDDLAKRGVREVDLGPVRPDATIMTELVGIAGDRGYQVNCHQEDLSLELDLPATWEEYLSILSKKQRHEVRRKLRHLWQADEVIYRCLSPDSQAVGGLMDNFLKLFSLSQKDKAGFMTARMESFFRLMSRDMAELGLLCFGVLELAGQVVAMVIAFDFNGVINLYNSAYDPGFSSLSVGLLCKVLCIKESIQIGRKKWDFLKGSEPYKHRIGGNEIPISRCHISIK